MSAFRFSSYEPDFNLTEEIGKIKSPEQIYQEHTKKYNDAVFEYKVEQERRKNFKQGNLGESGKNWVRDLGASIVGEIIYENTMKPDKD